MLLGFLRGAQHAWAQVGGGQFVAVGKCDHAQHFVAQFAHIARPAIGLKAGDDFARQWRKAAAERLEPPAGADPFDAADHAGADAVQLIGDAALRACAERPEWRPVDLGAAWRDLTRLPFVFAGWIGRAGTDPAATAAPLAEAAARGLAQLDAISAAAGATHPLGPEFVRRYLQEDLTWRLPRLTLERCLAEFAARLEA